MALAGGIPDNRADQLGFLLGGANATLRYLLLLFGIVTALRITTAQAATEDITATLTASQPTLTVGDVVTLTLQVTHSAGSGIVPVTPDRNWGDFEVRNLSPITSQSNSAGSETSQQQIAVTLWQTGTYGTPALPVKLVDAQGQQSELLLQPISLTVTSVLTGSDSSLRDLKPQASLPLPPLWPWIAGAGLALLLLVAGGWWLYRQRRQRATTTPVVMPDLRPAYQIALDDLARLQQLQLPAQQRFKEHYSQATDVLRRYLTNAFAIPAIDQTTHEIRQALKQSGIAAEQKGQLLSMLSEADLVKFADVTPAEQEAEELMVKAGAFVLATKPASEPTAATPGTANNKGGVS